ncbi:MAG: rRNA maturation RNase YbeY [Saprospiraceae bacterium]
MSDPDFPTPDSSDDGLPIHFFAEDVDFEPEHPEAVMTWLQEVIIRESCRLHGISYIFCSDEYLYRLNVDFLQHDTYTDIITFPYSAPPVVEGDIYISIDRVKENAGSFGTDFGTELHRVMVHGVLHLCGYGDESDEEEMNMRQKENECLALFASMK